MYNKINKCRLCGGTNLIEIMSLGHQTLTGVFPKSKDEFISKGPVTLVKCHGFGDCGLVQLRESYSLSEMYGSNYGYRSGLNASMVKHLRSKIENIVNKKILRKGDLVIDVGSNDATSLKAYPQGEYRLVGVDPSGKKFSSYYSDGIELIADFFSAEKVKACVGETKARVITSFSMFYDLEDPLSFAKEVEELLADDGIWVFEQSYLPAMLKANSFDTICQEHLEYYSFKQIQWIAEKANLKIIDIEFNDVNGGSFSVVATKKGSLTNAAQEKINLVVESEKDLGLDGLNVYRDFLNRVNLARSLFQDFINKCCQEGKSVYGLGASTKGNVLLQYYGVNAEKIIAIGEVNPDKYGAYTPGSLIPILPEVEVLGRNPDYLVVLPWHFREFFVGNPKFKNSTLVFPLPHLEVFKNS